MHLTQDFNVRDFYAGASELLLQDEASNNLILGTCEALIARSKTPEGMLFLRFIEKDKTTAAFIQSPKAALMQTAANAHQLQALCDWLVKTKQDFPGVVGPAETSRTFAELWNQKQNRPLKLSMPQKMMKLTSVIHPTGIKGRFQLAQGSETSLVAEWLMAFAKEILPPHESDNPKKILATAEQTIASGRCFLWMVGNDFVTMTLAGRPTRNGVAIFGVYTPPEFRKNGYASALVAKVSEYQLKAGKKFCVLYTDATNPTSNKIYRKVGFQNISDSNYFVF